MTETHLEEPPRDPNWSQAGRLLPIDTLADTYEGPILLADETQTIRWFQAVANKNPVQHVFHMQDKDGAYMQGEEGEPLVDTVMIAPAFWAMAEVLD